MANDEQLKLRVFAVIDTNVVVSSLLSDGGAPAEVMGYVDSSNVVPLYDDRTLNEYEQVLSYAKLSIDANKREETLQSIKDNGILVTDVRETERLFFDKDDVPFFEIKVEAEDDLDPYLVTGNKRHFPVGDSHIVTPSEMVPLMRQLNRFVEKDWYCPKDLSAAVKALLDNNPKYVPGKKCAKSFGLLEEAKAATLAESVIDKQCRKVGEPQVKGAAPADRAMEKLFPKDDAKKEKANAKANDKPHGVSR